MVGERRERYKRRGRWWERGEERGIREEGGGGREEKREV